MKRQIGSIFYKPGARPREIQRRRWNFPRIALNAIRKTCTVIGAIILFSILMGMTVGIIAGKSTSLPKDMILVWNIESAVGETPLQASFVDPFARQTMTVAEMITAFDKAAKDKRVRGILVSLDNAAFELAHIQELRQAIKRFRDSGKFAHIYTPSFSDLGSGIGAYYFASAFEQIWMQPVGFVSITGLSMEMPFARGALEKIGANPQFLHREEYKSAMESFTNSSMSPANREMMKSLLDDISLKITTDITEDRKILSNEFSALMDKGLLTGEESLKVGLITRLDYADVMVKELREKITGKKDSYKPELVEIENYHSSLVDSSKRTVSSDVALVHVAGEIIPGSGANPGRATGDYIAQAIHEAADDETIKAIVVRVDSPGGSPTASETIRRAIVHAKDKGKKVVVSMGPVAASGGYWVAVNADRIFALPSTLTGSIGVIMGKFEISGLWKKLGVNWDGMSWGQNAGLWSMNDSFTASERERLNVAIESTYNNFLDRVAEGRGMKKEAVREIAKGRAWTGAQAQKNGLVDELGGLDDALDYTAVQIGLKDRHELNIVPMPKPLSAMERFLLLVGGQVRANEFFKTLSHIDGVNSMLRRVEAIERSGPFQTYDPDLRLLKN
jgi:protease-4